MSAYPVIVGQWSDHTSGRIQILTTEMVITVTTAILTVCLATASYCVFQICRVSFGLLDQWWRTDHDTLPERQRLLRHSSNLPHDSGSPRTHEDDFPGEAWRRAREGRELFREAYDFITKPGAVSKTFFLFTALVALCALIGMIIAEVFSNDLIATRAALWSSKRCGVWQFDEANAGVPAGTRDDILQRKKESRAGEYAADCYDDPHLLDSIRCGLFDQRNITYTFEISYECIFNDKSVCREGEQSIVFDTGLKSARDVGINVKNPYYFRRTSTCAPLRLDYPFVQNVTENGITSYQYYYGGIEGVDSRSYTYLTIGDPFDIRIPAYSMALYTYSTASKGHQVYWKPIPELMPTGHGSITIMFISPLHIFYERQPVLDPVFHANESEQIPGLGTWYYRSDPRVRPFACIDRTYLCSPNGLTCWSMNDEAEPKGLPPDYWLLKLSLVNSDIYNSTSLRMGSALEAQQLLSQYISKHLEDNHWMRETERMFATSLARIQFDVFNIASGEDSIHEGEDGYINVTPKEAGNLCGLFRFRSAEHRNIDRQNLICWLSVLPIAWILSREARHVRKAWKKSCSKLSRARNIAFLGLSKGWELGCQALSRTKSGIRSLLDGNSFRGRMSDDPTSPERIGQSDAAGLSQIDTISPATPRARASVDTFENSGANPWIENAYDSANDGEDPVVDFLGGDTNDGSELDGQDHGGNHWHPLIIHHIFCFWWLWEKD